MSFGGWGGLGPARQWERVGGERVGDVGDESDAMGSAHWLGREKGRGGQRGAAANGRDQTSQHGLWALDLTGTSRKSARLRSCWQTLHRANTLRSSFDCWLLQFFFFSTRRKGERR